MTRIGVITLLTLNVLFVFCEVTHNDVAPDTLLQVHTVFRHGARAPVKAYPRDPNHSEDNWPNGFGHLTQEGLQQHFSLGSFFRRRYRNFLSSWWRYDEVRIQSSDQDRSLNSAAANTAGLYMDHFRSNESREFVSGLPWSPVPIDTIPRTMDFLIDTDRSCERFQQLREHLEQSPKYKSFLKEIQPMMRELEGRLGTNITTTKEAGMAYDNFKIQKAHNMTTPDWYEPMIPKLARLEQLSFEMLGVTEEQKRLRSGPMISKILEDFHSKVKSPWSSKLKFRMYSGHDTTVSGNLQAISSYNRLKPPFASAVIYELHQIESHHYIKLFYHNDTSFSTVLHELSIPGCAILCRLEDFQTLMTPLLPGDIKEECRPVTDIRPLYAYGGKSAWFTSSAMENLRIPLVVLGSFFAFGAVVLAFMKCGHRYQLCGSENINDVPYIFV